METSTGLCSFDNCASLASSVSFHSLPACPLVRRLLDSVFFLSQPLVLYQRKTLPRSSHRHGGLSRHRPTLYFRVSSASNIELHVTYHFCSTQIYFCCTYAPLPCGASAKNRIAMYAVVIWDWLISLPREWRFVSISFHCQHFYPQTKTYTDLVDPLDPRQNCISLLPVNNPSFGRPCTLYDFSPATG